MRFLRQIVATALACVVLAAPLAVSALSTKERTVTFNTALSPEYYGAGEFDGVLHLTFSRNGTIMGYYRDVDSAEIVGYTYLYGQSYRFKATPEGTKARSTPGYRRY